MSSQPGPESQSATRHELTDRDRQMLQFEGQWWKYQGAKDEAIREQFGMSPTRYYQIVNALILRDDALVAEPMIVKRLRRLRAARARGRRG